jgi:hypothetical protein
VTRGRALAALAAGVVFGAAVAPTRALAASASCGRPDLIDSVPTDGAADVPQNAAFFAHYDPSAEYVDETVTVTDPSATSTSYDGKTNPTVVSWDPTQGLLRVQLPTPLLPGSYRVAWPSLRGLETASPGEGGTVSYTVGATLDAAPPDFGGLTSIGWDLERRENDCTNALEDRMVFDLGVAAASDDGGHDGLALVVFQTAGGDVAAGSPEAEGGAGPVEVLTEPMPAAGTHAQVRLPVADATGHVCFSALARDLTGKISNSGSAEVCIHTTAPPFFRGCAVAPASSRGARGDAVALAALALAVVARRGRGSRARRS